jgi:hypothetical protein
MRLVVMLMVGLALSLVPGFFFTTTVTSGASTVETVAQRRRRPQKKAQRPQSAYTQFSHTTHVTNQKLTCDACHKFPTRNWETVRKGDAAFQDVAEFPEHATCLNCHRTQFFARQRPAPAICSNCHVNVTPRDTVRFLFPSLGDVADAASPRRDVVTEFAINFPHDKHIDVVGWKRPSRLDRLPFVTVSWQQKPGPGDSDQPKSCPVCHQTFAPQSDSESEYATTPPKELGDNFWLKKGSFKTSPNSHASCFTCHNVEAELPPAPSDCKACHKLAAHTSLKADFDPAIVKTMMVVAKPVLVAWPRRISSGTYRHEGGEHPNLSCLKCHDAATMNTTDRKTFSVPIRTCGGAEGCHITATTDDGGILNYEIDQKKAKASFVCTKCHITFGKQTLPESHVKAIQTLKKP